MDTTITTLEMCAGYGGIGLGLKNIFGSRLRTIAYCELEGFAQANLISKMEKGLLDAAPIWSDLKAFPYESFHGLVDILIAGYPCQPFSAAGKRAGKDDPRHLWPWIADGIRLLKPRMCFFENVEGHISLGLSTVISDLEELGYKVAAGLFSAAECLDASGRTAPHQRKRIFIMAHDKQQGLEGFSKYRASICRKDQRIFTWDGSSREELAHLSSERLERYRAVGIEKLHESHSEKLIACCNSQNVWPSRPGEQQHKWEPPRVVGNAVWIHEHKSIGGKPQQHESWNASKAMGNAECLRISTARKHGAMDEASGIPADRKGCEPSQTDSVAGSSRKRESSRANAAECHEITPSMGDPIDGASSGMGDSKLSTLCDSELAEIREWMVKCDNRTDELRLLGNGVVPATAERAFLTLWEELNK